MLSIAGRCLESKDTVWEIRFTGAVFEWLHCCCHEHMSRCNLDDATGWIVNDPETGKTIRCNSKQEFDLEVRRCVAVARMIKAGKECKDYLIAIVAKMKAEKEAKEQEKLSQKALKREQELEMIRPQGEVMRSKVKTFAAALKLEGDPASWSKEILVTNVDEATGRKLCQDAFAAQRKDREDKSLMISVNESDRLVARQVKKSFGLPPQYPQRIDMNTAEISKLETNYSMLTEIFEGSFEFRSDPKLFQKINNTMLDISAGVEICTGDSSNLHHVGRL
eukprot:g54693.t1